CGRSGRLCATVAVQRAAALSVGDELLRLVRAGGRDAYRAFLYTIRQPATPFGLHFHHQLSAIREPRVYGVRRIDRCWEGCLVCKVVCAEPHQCPEEHLYIELAVCAPGDHYPAASTGHSIRLQILRAGWSVVWSRKRRARSRSSPTAY